MNPIDMLSSWMFEALKFFAVFAGGNYGWAIILLTVAVNLALYPLTLQSTRQMSAMQKLQPKIKALQEKHKKDPQKLQSETMELYKSEKINPLGGCLPLLLKLPFFIAIFFALQSPEFKAILALPKAQAGFLWMPNLAVPDHTYILVTLIALTTYLSQITMGPAQPGMQAMTLFMPIFIAFISVGFPAGVQIYWVVSNLIMIVQQVYINRGMERAKKTK